MQEACAINAQATIFLDQTSAIVDVCIVFGISPTELNGVSIFSSGDGSSLASLP